MDHHRETEILSSHRTRHILLQNVTATLLQNVPGFFITNVTVLLQNASILLQNATSIKKCIRTLISKTL